VIINRSRFGQIVLAACCVALGTIGLGCEDPVRDGAEAALGPEAPGVPKGPLHRPGQPCLVCHDPQGKGAPAFAMAGTVYSDEDTLVPVNEATVVLQDGAGHTQTASTNCAGNFILRPGELTLQYPIWVTMQGAGQTIDMESPIYRDGSCASCHTDPKSPTSAGHVFLLANPQELPARFHCP
jgi:hypothetical protein